MLTPFIIPLFVNSIAANSFLSLIQKVIVLDMIVAHPITLKWWAVIPTIWGVMIWFEIGLAAAYAAI